MSHRFFIESNIGEAQQITLSGQEARHLSRVMRAAPGDQVTLFDGGGDEFSAEVSAITKSSVQLAVVARLQISREATTRVSLGVALPKGDRQRWLIEKATELGVATLTPLVTDHGVAQPTPQALARLERAVIESSKQCGRNRLLQVASPVTCEQFFPSAPAAAARWFAHPTATADVASQPIPSDVWIAIGPEGGFSPREMEAAETAGWTSLRLGKRIFRTETAAIALASYAILTHSD